MMGNTAQSRREAREAQRKQNIRKWVAVGGAGVILLSGGIFAANLAANKDNPETNPQVIPSSCTTTQRVTVETTASMAEVLKNVPVDAQKCIVLSITDGSSATDIAQQIIEGKSAPNLWIPDSSTRAELALAGKAEVIAKSESLAKSPVVIVTSADSNYSSWNEALADSTNLQMSDPKTDSAAFMAFINASGEVSNGKADEKTLTSSTGLRAQTIGVDSPVQSAEELLAKVNSGEIKSAIVTESDYANYLDEHTDAKFKAYIPATGSGELNYPMYQTTVSSGTNTTVADAADMISDYIASDEGKKALEEAGLRTADDTELADSSVGAVTALAAKDPEIISTMWTSYSLQSAPMNALIAIDASGSMAEKIGTEGKTRMDITRDSITGASQLFPERDSMGLWKFAYKIDGESNYQEVVPVRNLAEDVDGKDQRDVLLEQISSIQPYERSYTGLNDTILAAFRNVKENYESGSANLVVVITDGENTAPGSVSEEEMIKTIQAEQDTNNPVYFVMIGISEEADMEGLERVASQIGGKAFPASSVEDMQKVFQEGLSVSSSADDTSEETAATETETEASASQ